MLHIYQPSAKFTCSMVPAPPSPWTTSMLLMICGKSFGIRLLESRISALKMREGAIGQVNSCVKLMTPMYLATKKNWSVKIVGDLHQLAVFMDWVWHESTKEGTYQRFKLVPL